MRVRIVGMRDFLAGFGLALLSDLEAQTHRARTYETQCKAATAEFQALHDALEGKNEDLDSITTEYNAMVATQGPLVARSNLHEATILELAGKLEKSEAALANVTGMYQQACDNILTLEAKFDDPAPANAELKPAQSIWGNAKAAPKKKPAKKKAK